jgi:hypothetical protein
MCGRRGIDRDRAYLDPICSIHLEGAIGADSRPRELSVSATNGQVASGIAHRHTSTAARPSAERKRRFARPCRDAAAREQQAT